MKLQHRMTYKIGISIILHRLIILLDQILLIFVLAMDNSTKLSQLIMILLIILQIQVTIMLDFKQQLIEAVKTFCKDMKKQKRQFDIIIISRKNLVEQKVIQSEVIEINHR